MKAILSLMFVLYFIEITVSNPLDELTPCKRDDSECILKRVRYFYHIVVIGNKELGLENNDPLHQDLIEMNLSELKYKINDVNTYGFGMCSVESAILSETSLNLNLFCPNFTVHGKYEVDGKLTVIPIQGKGDFSATATNYKLAIDIELKRVNGEDGKTYFTVKNFKFRSDLEGKLNINLSHLFKEQNQLNEEFNKLINKSPKEVAKEIQDPILTSNLKKLAKSLNKLLKYIPIDKLLSE